ncbi:hypothetical protein LTR23_010018, partial [Exophiala sp. CCFEE 6169]
MADPAVPPPPGSRAIKIPVHMNNNTDHRPLNRRRRSARYIKNAERAESSDAGPSSLGSDQESTSAWSYNSTSARTDHFRSVASPGQGNQLPLISTRP